ncbi:HAD family hydrolase [Paenibacillus sp. NPDC058071]|uniref:HAD family hydrolase n=1 Tax=Paenibacillus sp. NPDC058071 TaxID=3346326 RepID=UPI0036D867F5
MIKLIVSDLDGTLMDHTRSINGRDRQAVQKALDNGLELCIASGRMYAEIKTIMQSFEHRFHALGQNGATIYNKNQRLAAAYEFAPDISASLMELTQLDDRFVHFVHCTDDSYYTSQRNEVTLPYESRILISCKERVGLAADLAEDRLRSSKISFFGPIEGLLQLEAELNRRFSDQVETFISDKDCLDVMPKNVSKGASLTLLIEKLGLRPDEVACIGDSFNDLSMFAITPHSYAMAGSHADVRSQASHAVASVADAIDDIINGHHTTAIR